MDKKTRNLIRKAEKNGILIEETTRREDLATFTNIYLDTMEKNQAHAKYLFPQIFYERTMDLLQDTISLFVAKYQEKIIAASLFMHQYDYIHYHFSGSDKNYRQYAPNNLLLWTVIQWGQQKGYKTFHLGGGLGQDESLFRFKAGFSDERARFCTASIIHDTETYQRLNKLKDALDKKKTSQEEPSSFFPYYRKP
jgi:lipid II:glycine glycyltransferase (peptidoglycan interpeptide bridge formation enzyme)